MSHIFITLFAYFIDKYFGEIPFIKHPILIITNMIAFFENRYYKKDVLQGIYLVLFMLISVGFTSFLLEEFLSYLSTLFDIIISSIIASMFISHRELSRNLRNNETYKEAIEDYTNNLTSNVTAPLLYLLLFGLPGIIIYKTISTLDSLVGFKTPKYEKFGKASALLDDVLNYLPSRLTASLIMFIAGQKDLFAFYKDGKKYTSPNTGHPIAAMALALGVKLGGNTSKNGKTKKTPVVGKGRKTITQDDIKKVLTLF